MHEPQKSQEGMQLVTVDFTTMLEDLMHPQAFPFAPLDTASIALIQTHASAVILTPDRVYKLKKPRNFGFLDYSMPALRRHFCQQEVLLNGPLAPQVYLGVAPVLKFPGGSCRFGPILLPDATPPPGTTFGGGTIVDYAVVMVRLPDTALLESWVRTGKVEIPLLAEIARFLATFHKTAHTGEHIADFGSPDVIREICEDNFVRMKPYIGRTLDHATYDHIVAYVRQFLDVRTPLFASRVRGGYIRDCHGDFRLEHVYILDNTSDPPHSRTRLAILDRVEFNERFRYGDVASEIAFLAMELDSAGRSDLLQHFVDAYIAATGDSTLCELLAFYLCYRAYVRGNVYSFQSDESEVPVAQREASRQQAAELFSLAAHYANSPIRPMLIMVGGLIGTGKSTIALALQQKLGGILLSSDIVSKQLAQLDPPQLQVGAFDQRECYPECTYDTLQTEVSTALAHGHSVLLDASFMRRTDRQIMTCEARAHGATVLFVECVCPPETVHQRLRQRWDMLIEPTDLLSDPTSDGYPDLYERQYAMWEPFVSDEEPGIQHVVVTTTQPVAQSYEQVLDALNVPRLICWLEWNLQIPTAQYTPPQTGVHSPFVPHRGDR
jgi:aminoglycoside phosphotransferase family enzyme/predicted kinase